MPPPDRHRGVLPRCCSTACDRKEYYRQAGNPPGQNPNGTPADRTGGARKTADDGAGGGSTEEPPAGRSEEMTKRTSDGQRQI